MPRQQLTFFNRHCDSWCYLPLLALVTFDRESEQHLCAAVLRAGNAQASDGTLGVLRGLLALLRSALPEARFLVRLVASTASTSGTTSCLSTVSRAPGAASWRPRHATASSLPAWKNGP